MAVMFGMGVLSVCCLLYFINWWFSSKQANAAYIHQCILHMKNINLNGPEHRKS